MAVRYLRAAECVVAKWHSQPPTMGLGLGHILGPGRRRAEAESQEEAGEGILPGCRGQQEEAGPYPAVEKDGELL